MGRQAELIGNYFGSIYLTVISLLQGLALQLLVPIIIDYFKVSPNPWTDVHILPLLIMLLIIFVIWHHYAIGIFYLRWFPNIIDTMIPFMISIGQFFMISFLTIHTTVADMNMHAWIIGLALFLTFGSSAYFAASLRLEPGLFTNIMSLSRAIEHVNLSKRVYRMAGYSILFQGFFAFVVLWTHLQELLYASMFFFLAHLIISEYFILTRIKAHFVQALDEEM